MRLAPHLKVLHQESSTLLPLALNDEQLEIIDALLGNELTLVLKGRQVGISTVCCLHDLVFALVNPGVNVAIAADTEKNAVGLLAKCSAWARQLGISLDVANTTSVTLPNGSTIDALSAVATADDGESRVGRSRSYALVHASELAFWRNANAVFAALTSTMPTNGRIVIESTGTPAEGLFRALWDDDGNGWKHVFLEFERHAAYRMPPESITDDEWAHAALEYGFERRDSAAWWLARLRAKFAGDAHRCLREYPVRASHAFSFAEGRWIFDYTPATVVEAGAWSFYRPRAQLDEPVVFGVDTATGAGKDSSVIAIRGQRTRKLWATWKANTVNIPGFTLEVLAAIEAWHPLAVCVEDNGVGEVCYQGIIAAEPDTEVLRHHSSGDDGEKWVRMARVKSEIESGALPIGPEVIKEVKHSIIKRRTKDGNLMIFAGPDDALNAIGFAGVWLDANPYVKGSEPTDVRDVVSVARLLKSNGRRRGGH